jgi:hypothetical protein
MLVDYEGACDIVDALQPTKGNSDYTSSFFIMVRTQVGVYGARTSSSINLSQDESKCGEGDAMEITIFAPPGHHPEPLAGELQVQLRSRDVYRQLAVMQWEMWPASLTRV